MRLWRYLTQHTHSTLRVDSHADELEEAEARLESLVIQAQMYRILSGEPDRRKHPR